MNLPVSLMFPMILASCSMNKLYENKNHIIEMTELSNLELGLSREGLKSAVSAVPADSLQYSIEDKTYTAYLYYCKIGQTEERTGVRVSIAGSPGSSIFMGGSSHTPTIDFWITYLAGELVFKGPIRKYETTDSTVFREISKSLSKRNGDSEIQMK